MFFNKLTYPLVFVVLLIAGLAFVAIPVTEAVTPVLSVTDELANVEGELNTQGIQRYGIRVEPVSFPLTITFQVDPTADDPVNAQVTGFEVDDIVLQALDNDNNQVLNGATAASLTTTDNAVWTTTITVKGNVSKVNIAVPAESAETLPIFSPGNFQPGTPVPAQAVIESVEIIRSAAPPLTLSDDRSIPGNAPFMVELTSTQAITLTRTDIKVTGGSIDSLTPDAARRVWAVTIRPGVAITQVTVEPSANGSYIFRKGTFTVDVTGPVATIDGTPPVGGGVFPITITFDDSLDTNNALLPGEITVIGGSITALFAIPTTDSYVATLTPNPSATTVTVQVKAGAVANVGGVLNLATPSSAHTFTVAATAAPPPPVTTPRRGSDDVTISEIMFATDREDGEIQWIELSNNSATETVALNAGSGWELRIENYGNSRAARRRLSGTINFKNNGNVRTIPPRQAVLIVSANGRNSDRVHFTASRVFKVYPTLDAEFGMRAPQDPFLHPTEGFHIKLVDGSGNFVDEVGNLDGDVLTTDRPAWELPSGWAADGSRSSIIRRHSGGIADDGTLSDGWIRAVRPRGKRSFQYLLERNIKIWYGLEADRGSPGIRAGGALPVQLSQFRPDLTETGTVVINWTTESEVDNAGFNILRSQTRTGEFKVINAQLIPGAGTTAERNTYTWTDTTAKPNVVYYYQIEDVSFAGERQALATVRLRGFVSATGKLTTQWGQLKRSRD